MKVERCAVIAVDPGRNLGVACLARDGQLLSQFVIDLAAFRELTLPAAAAVVVGDGTGSEEVLRALAERGVKAELVDETGSSLEGRQLHWQLNPPRGLLRLLPSGLLPVPTGLDGWAAYAIGLRWLADQPADGASNRERR